MVASKQILPFAVVLGNSDIPLYGKVDISAINGESLRRYENAKDTLSKFEVIRGILRQAVVSWSFVNDDGSMTPLSVIDTMPIPLVSEIYTGIFETPRIHQAVVEAMNSDFRLPS